VRARTPPKETIALGVSDISSSSKRTRICFLLGFFAMVACARRYATHREPSCPPAQAETRITSDPALAGAIAGTVLDRDSARPLREARVDLMPTGRIGMTDSSGHFAFADVQAGTYQLTVRRIGYQRHTDTLTVRRQQGVRAQLALTTAAVDRCFAIVEVRTPLPWWHFW
jgi:hypothetical protein